MKYSIAGFFIIVLLFPLPSFAYETIEGYTLDQWANAIYKAENSKSHPYGVLVHYKSTSPRQACINTVKHKYRDWIKLGKHGKFISYLASKYAPRHVLNDPLDLNKNWINNVQYYLTKGV